MAEHRYRDFLNQRNDPLILAANVLALISVASMVSNLIRWHPLMVLVGIAALSFAMAARIVSVARRYTLDREREVKKLSGVRTFTVFAGTSIACVIISLVAKG